jgi:hypothetical protein
LLAISSCSDVSDKPETSAGLKDIEEPALSVVETATEETTIPIDPTENQEPTAVGDEVQEVEVNTASAESSALPERDDLKGMAAYCWANPDRCEGKGDPSAPVILVEISDYGCGHCRNFNLETADVISEQYVESGDVYWIVVPYALAVQRPQAPASALCAAEQGEFFKYHRRLFEINGDADAGTVAGFSRAAGEIGLDVNAFKACMESERFYTVVQQNVDVAQSLGVNATPYFFIGEQSLIGNIPLDTFRQRIDSELEAKG